MMSNGDVSLQDVATMAMRVVVSDLTEVAHFIEHGRTRGGWTFDALGEVAAQHGDPGAELRLLTMFRLLIESGAQMGRPVPEIHLDCVAALYGVTNRAHALTPVPILISQAIDRRDFIAARVEDVRRRQESARRVTLTTPVVERAPEGRANKLRSLLAVMGGALLMGLLLTLAGPAVAQAPAVVREAPGVAARDAGVLARGASNVMLEHHGVCRWLDNTGADDLFVPYRTAQEWLAFVTHAPASVVRDACCPPLTVTLTATDGQTQTQTLPAGRDRAGHPLNARTVSGDFAMVAGTGGVPPRPQDCVTHFNGETTCTSTSWVERVSQTFTCAGGAWSAGDATATPPPPANPPAYIGPRTCPPAYAHGARWFETTGAGSRAATLADCPLGIGSRSYAFDVETEFRCHDGTASPTGATRERNGRWVGACVETAEIAEVSAVLCGSQCQWGGLSTPTVADLTWSNAARVCAEAGYPYLVGASGAIGPQGCSSCRWSQWSYGGRPAVPELASAPIPAPTSGAWSEQTHRNVTSFSRLHKAWCSNAPGQRLPAVCAAGEATVALHKITWDRSYRRYRNTPATFTATFPEGRVAEIDRDGWYAYPFMPEDAARAPLYRAAVVDQNRGVRASLENTAFVAGVRNASDGSVESVTLLAECRPGSGWHVYGECIAGASHHWTEAGNYLCYDRR